MKKKGRRQKAEGRRGKPEPGSTAWLKRQAEVTQQLAAALRAYTEFHNRNAEPGTRNPEPHHD